MEEKPEDQVWRYYINPLPPPCPFLPEWNLVASWKRCGSYAQARQPRTELTTYLGTSKPLFSSGLLGYYITYTLQSHLVEPWKTAAHLQLSAFFTTSPLQHR
jgi:hypothetical protein